MKTFAENRRISHVFAEIEELAKKDSYFKTVVDQYQSADCESRNMMDDYLLEIYTSARNANMSLRTAIELSAY